MDREKTIEFWEECQASRDPKAMWNKWAGNLIEKKGVGDWVVEASEDGKLIGKNAFSRDWIENADVDFSGHIFNNKTDLSGFIFPGFANFSYSKTYSTTGGGGIVV